jgi:hypothetical protein
MLSIVKLESAIFTLLTSKFPPSSGITFSNNYPRSQKELTQNKTIVCISSISDSVEGKIITRELLHPLVSLAIFSIDYFRNRQVQELLISTLDSSSPFELLMPNQQAFHWFCERRLPPTFTPSLEIYSGAVDYRILLRDSPPLNRNFQPLSINLSLPIVE